MVKTAVVLKEVVGWLALQVSNLNWPGHGHLINLQVQF